MKEYEMYFLDDSSQNEIMEHCRTTPGQEFISLKGVKYLIRQCDEGDYVPQEMYHMFGEATAFET